LQIGCDEAVRCPVAESERSGTMGDDKHRLWILESGFAREGDEASASRAESFAE
jgi:hypothetical protein